jgi:hypothetical protein
MYWRTACTYRMQHSIACDFLIRVDPIFFISFGLCVTAVNNFETLFRRGSYLNLCPVSRLKVILGELPTACIFLIFYFSYLLTLKMAICSSETWLTLNGLQGVISQEMILFITTAVKTSNPT